MLLSRKKRVRYIPRSAAFNPSKESFAFTGLSMQLKTDVEVLDALLLAAAVCIVAEGVVIVAMALFRSDPKDHSS